MAPFLRPPFLQDKIFFLLSNREKCVDCNWYVCPPNHKHLAITSNCHGDDQVGLYRLIDECLYNRCHSVRIYFLVVLAWEQKSELFWHRNVITVKLSAIIVGTKIYTLVSMTPNQYAKDFASNALGKSHN